MARIRNNYKGKEFHSVDKGMTKAELEKAYQDKYGKADAEKKARRETEKKKK